MGLQLIFVVETNSTCKSDWIYIKDTIDYFYTYDNAHVKFSPIYLGGKNKYLKKDKEIRKLISQYEGAAKSNLSKVIFCFDCDNYDSKTEDANFLRAIQIYCADNNYEFAWFCKDIERVYLDRKVANSEKKKEAAAFKAKKAIQELDKTKLEATTFKLNTSNIMTVLNKFINPR